MIKKQMLFSIDINDYLRYFFEGGETIPNDKRTLLKRMLMGLTSYYPIDRSSIVNMPAVLKPEIYSEKYQNYEIVQNMNVVPCMMSETQFEKYSEKWSKEKELDTLNKMKKWSSEDDTWHYYMRTRQTCNMIYVDDDFRNIKKTENNTTELETLKAKSYQTIISDESLKITKDLKYLSPKMYAMMNNINKYIKDKQSTGKILFYSDFRSDGGSEAFELVLKCNGYEKFDTKKPQKDKKLRYTFITGSEGPDERKISKQYYNDENNKYGEYIQIMIISSAGAEGISLWCVRQVHILEPFWNYVRIDQVLGRAIRMKSHEQLPKEERDVEQFLYLSTLPEGTNLEQIYLSLMNDPNKTWEIPTFSEDSIKQELFKVENRDIKEKIDSILRINTDTNNNSADQHLFEIMETKYKLSLEINSIIKESSLDCIKHTRDDPELNDKCIRFSNQLIGEISYFPGINAEILENTDVIQLKAKFMYHIKPNTYVISAANDEGNNIFIYYEYSTDKKDIDIRYIRENGKRLCDIYLDTQMILNYVPKNHPFNSKLGKEFSVYQEIYSLDDSILDTYINMDKFPSLDKLISEDNLEGYKLKYNINETFYYMGIDSILPDKCLRKIYPYNIYEGENYNVESINPIIIHKNNLYIKA